MDKDSYEKLKDEHGQYASWAIWDTNKEDPNKWIPDEKPLDYEKIKEKMKPNIILVGLNPSSEIKKEYSPFINFHVLKNDPRNLNPKTIEYNKKLVYAIKGSKFEGAYMTDIFPNIVEPIADNIKVDKKEVPYYIKLLKKQLELIGSEEPLVIAFGVAAHAMLKKHFKCIKAEHYSNRTSGSPEKVRQEKYKKIVWDAIDDAIDKSGIDINPYLAK
ncbi:MAG: hypothetical protein LBH25_13175 [Fibromonadaceae bacterium]|jgi:hypothetical protein|nr:hypothetical protein [Fibromonadaceae bacterium]